MSLRYLIENDVGPDGCRLLPKFLAVNDLLHLALCCRKTILYRSHLRNFIIQHTGEMSALKKRRLNTVLGEQLCPRSVVIRDHRIIPLLLRWILSTKSVRAVTFAPVVRPDSVTTNAIAKAVHQGYFKRVYNIGFYNLDMSRILAGITRLSCPRLRIASFDYCFFNNPVALGLTVAYLSGLKRLAVRHCVCNQSVNYSLISCVAMGLNVHKQRPCLVELQLVDLWTTEMDTVFYAETTEAGAFRHLQTLTLSKCNFGNTGLSVMFSTLNKENSPDLRNISVVECGVGVEAIDSLIRAVANNKIPSIRKLHCPFEKPELLQQVLNVVNPSLVLVS